MADHEAAVRGSALWAAWGDALGFMTELTDASGLKYRAGVDRVHTTVSWRRKIGGRYGVQINLPAGAYSDDTQLRLATSRAIRGDGEFDVEAFAKVELTSWQNYCLGAGRGSKAAAAAMVRRDSAWHRNVFKSGAINYTNIGGNGAAMRIQPHVWAARDLNDIPQLVSRVVRDSVCTHGHPVGIVGAVIHALTLARTLRFRELPGPAVSETVSRHLNVIHEAFDADIELAAVWVPAWEAATQRSFHEALDETILSAREQGAIIAATLSRPRRADLVEIYPQLLHDVGGLDDATRGSAVTTAWMANFATHLHASPSESLRVVANVLGSDTDTIATMAGAILGAVVTESPPGEVQDQRLIEAEAHRLAAVASGKPEVSYRYPDLMKWRAPRAATDLVGICRDQLALAGHGMLSEIEDGYSSGRGAQRSVYRWARTPIGQRVLVHHRSEIGSMSEQLLPKQPPWQDAAIARRPARAALDQPPGAPTSEVKSAMPPSRTSEDAPLSPTTLGDKGLARDPRVNLREALSSVVRSRFDPTTLGTEMLRVIDTDEAFGLENGAALGALIAQARHQSQTL